MSNRRLGKVSAIIILADSVNMAIMFNKKNMLSNNLLNDVRKVFYFL